MEKHENKYINNINILDFNIEDKYNSSVFLVNELEKYISEEDCSPYIIIALERAQNFHADAVYFRFFEDNRPPLPQIYIYDNINNHRSELEYRELHRNIWSASEIPIYFIIDNTQIRIFDSREPVTIKNGEIIVSPIDFIDLEHLSQYDEVIKNYNARLFDNGNFWNSDIASKNFLNNRTVYEKLITSLKCLRESFKDHSNLPNRISDQILILCILIKYLEENGEDDNHVNLAHDFFYKAVGHSTLVEVIRNQKIVDLFNKLADHFNGGIFSLSIDDQITLKNTNLEFLASFLEGTIVGTQRVFWEEYSFKHIPIELISNFYEEFLPKEKNESSGQEKKKDSGAVYTPAFLVNFLIDECLPLSSKQLNGNVKLIDASCGSGIFLVMAFKRLVQRWRILNRKEGKLADTNPSILKNILTNNIFGVDVDKNATALTIFSLNLSLCSMLTPKQIWTELAFDNLKTSGNIVEKDFFEYLIENKPSNFDLVIGNPPFKAINENKYLYYSNKLKENGLAFSCKIPDNQLALMFLEKTLDILVDNGMLCLIMPSGPLLYNKTLSFRKVLFNKYDVKQIIDFTFLKSILFKDVNVGTASIFIQKTKPTNNDILHVVTKRTRANKEKIFFEFDHYDFYNVPKTIACTIDFVWKCNLLGGERVYELVTKYTNNVTTIKDFLEKKRLESNWHYGQGYIVGKQNQKHFANYITGKNTVVDKNFTEEGIKKIEIQNNIKFKDKSRKELFEAPHLLLKKTIGKNGIIPIELRNDYLTFRNEIIGIHCPKDELKDLEYFESFLRNNNNLLRSLIIATSARAGISRSVYTHLAEDFYKLPFDSNIKLSDTDSIIVNDVSKYIIPYFELGEKSELNDIVSDFSIFELFSRTYCANLNVIYAKKQFSYKLKKILEGQNYFACEFHYTNIDSSYTYTKVENDLSSLIEYWQGESCLIKRVIRMYSQNRIVLIKPKQLRYWLESIALRDVDDTFDDIIS